MRVQPGKRIGLQEIWLTSNVGAEIDAGGVPAFKRMTCGKRSLAGKTRLSIVGALVDHQVLATLFIMQRVDVGLGILFQQDLADAEHGRILAVADDAYSELTARQIGL